MSLPFNRLAATSSNAGAVWRPSPTAVCALAVGLVAFVLRFLTSRSLTNDHYMHLAFAQQLLHGELPGRDFVDPGMPLTYGLSALIQRLSAGPFSEVLLCCAAIAVAAGLTSIIASRLTRSAAIGVAAAAFAVLMWPRLYNYPKLLVPALALLVVQIYLARPSFPRIIGLAAATVAGVLWRYDLGLYAGMAICTALVIKEASPPARAAKALLQYAAATLLIISPYLVYLQIVQGIPASIRDGGEFAKIDAHQLRYPWPAFTGTVHDFLSGAGNPDHAVFLYYAAYALAALPIVAVLTNAARRRRQEGDAMLAAVGVMLAAYLVVVLRHPIVSRIDDLATVMALAGAAGVVSITRIVQAMPSATPSRRIAATVAASAMALVFAGAFQSAYVVGDFDDHLAEHDFDFTPRNIREVVSTIKDTGTQWPWHPFWPTSGGVPEVVTYIHDCTSADDHLLTTWLASEYFFFAQRPFAAGHAFFEGTSFTAPSDQQLIMKRLTSTHVPIVLIDETRRQEFSKAYPALDDYLRNRYSAVDTYTKYDGETVSIAVLKDTQPRRSWGPRNWPCDLEPAASAAPAATSGRTTS